MEITKLTTINVVDEPFKVHVETDTECEPWQVIVRIELDGESLELVMDNSQFHKLAAAVCKHYNQ